VGEEGSEDMRMIGGAAESILRFDWTGTQYGVAFLYGVWALYEVSIALGRKREKGWRAARCGGGWTTGKVWGCVKTVQERWWGGDT
jgi:hypothetical protein